MKINWNYINMIVLLILVVFLYVFSSTKNAKRLVSQPNIQFIGNKNLFITQEAVSKLLIQNQQGITNVPKETLDLNELESTLNANTMIEFAEVYVNVEGKLIAEVKQKTPIARVISNGNYYIDSNGGVMPLSKNYTERVPLVTGFVNKDNLNTVYTVANYVLKDEFLKQSVIEIHQNKNNSVDLKLRQTKFVVHLGQVKHLEKKVNNLKAFYIKAIKDRILDKYSKVSLQFGNQVVCTKA